MSSYKELLEILNSEKNDELILESGKPILLRKQDQCLKITDGNIPLNELRELFKELLSEDKKSFLQKKGMFSIPFDYENKKMKLEILQDTERMMLRVSHNIPSLNSWADLDLHFSLEEVLNFSRGLVLVTSPQKSGKSSTLRAFAEEFSKKNKEVFIFESKPHLNQTNLIHNISFWSMNSIKEFRHIVNINPYSVLILDEVQDSKWAFEALQASFKGHLVLVSFAHLGVIPSYRHFLGLLKEHEPNIRDNLKAIVSQTLFNKKNKLRKTISQEFLILRPDTKENLVRIEKFLETQIYSQDWRPFEIDIEEQYERGEVSEATKELFSKDMLSWIKTEHLGVGEEDNNEIEKTSVFLTPEEKVEFVGNDEQSHITRVKEVKFQPQKTLKEEQSTFPILEKKESTLELSSAILKDKRKEIEKKTSDLPDNVLEEKKEETKEELSILSNKSLKEEKISQTPKTDLSKVKEKFMEGGESDFKDDLDLLIEGQTVLTNQTTEDKENLSETIFEKKAKSSKDEVLNDVKKASHTTSLKEKFDNKDRKKEKQEEKQTEDKTEDKVITLGLNQNINSEASYKNKDSFSTQNASWNLDISQITETELKNKDDKEGEDYLSNEFSPVPVEEEIYFQNKAENLLSRGEGRVVEEYLDEELSLVLDDVTEIKEKKIFFKDPTSHKSHKETKENQDSSHYEKTYSENPAINKIIRTKEEESKKSIDIKRKRNKEKYSQERKKASIDINIFDRRSKIHEVIKDAKTNISKILLKKTGSKK